MAIPFYTNVAPILSTEPIPSADEDHLDFIMKAVEIRIANPVMPVTTRCVLLTICGLQYIGLKGHIVFRHCATAEECVEAQCRIAALLSVDVRSVGDMALRISEDCTVKYGGILLIKGIAPA